MVATINKKPQQPKLYARLLTEEVIAARPRACALEATCREIRRTMTFLPSTAELLKILGAQMERWSGYAEISEQDFRLCLTQLEALIPKLKAKREEEAAEQARQQERAREYEAKRQAEREARERERKEAEERARALQEAMTAELARRKEEWERKHLAAKACQQVHPELWEAVHSDLIDKIATQDAATLAAMHEARGLFLYLAELVRARLRNGAMPKQSGAEDAMGVDARPPARSEAKTPWGRAPAPSARLECGVRFDPYVGLGGRPFLARLINDFARRIGLRCLFAHLCQQAI